MFKPFTEDHEHFRKTVRDFAEKELLPHAEEWENDELFPDSVFKRAGDLGILGAHYPQDKGGAGGDYWFSVVKAQELPRCQMAGTTLGLLVQSDMATPVIGDIGTREQLDGFLVPALAGDKIEGPMETFDIALRHRNNSDRIHVNLRQTDPPLAK